MANEFDAVTREIFRNKNILGEDYQPEEILERDEEKSLFREALKDVLFGDNPNNVFVYGNTGVGKTAVTRYMCQQLIDAAEDRDEADEILVLHHNCNGDSTYGTLCSLINQMRDPDDEQFPRKGLATRIALQELYSELDDFGGTVLVMLDEVDHLSDADTLLYEFPRARSNGHLEESRIGVIGISNDYTFRQSLSPKVRSTLMEKEISFSQYDAKELQTIIRARTEKALKDDSITNSAIALAAAYAAKDSGSARQALDIVIEAGSLAEERGAVRIEDTHIEEAKDRVERGRIITKIRDQSEHCQIVLEALARLDVDGTTPARSKEIRSEYTPLAEEYNRDPLKTLNSIREHLSDLEMLGFLDRTEHNEGRRGGSYYTFTLDVDADDVLDVRSDIRQQEQG